MNQAIARGNDLAPRDLRGRIAHGCRNMACGFADQFEIPKRGIVIEPASDMHSFLFDVGPQFSAQGLVGNQIDGAPEQVFQIELHAEIARRRCRAVE